MSTLGMTMWQLGEVDRAHELVEQAIRRATELGHSTSMAFPLQWKSELAILRGDAAAALSAADTMEVLCGQHGMPFWRARAEIYSAWARGRLHGAETSVADLRRALAAAVDQGGMGDAWFHIVLLAELEAETLGPELGLARIDEAIALARRVEFSQQPRLSPSSSRRPFSQARSVKCRLCGGSLSNCARHCEGARRAQLGPARCALSRKTLSSDRPPRRRARRPRARARRLFANTGNAGDRGSAGAASGAGGDG